MFKFQKVSSNDVEEIELVGEDGNETINLNEKDIEKKQTLKKKITIFVVAIFVSIGIYVIYLTSFILFCFIIVLV